MQTISPTTILPGLVLTDIIPASLQNYSFLLPMMSERLFPIAQKQKGKYIHVAFQPINYQQNTSLAYRICTLDTVR